MSQVIALTSGTAVASCRNTVRQTRRAAKPVVVARAQKVVKAQKSVKVAAVAAAASAPTVLAASQAVAHDALFTVAELGDTIDEETALFVLVGGSLALVTAVLSLVIGSNQFIKNFSNK